MLRFNFELYHTLSVTLGDWLNLYVFKCLLLKLEIMKMHTFEGFVRIK